MKMNELTSRVEKALDEIRPFLQSDGGDISLVNIDEELNVLVQLHGACIGCKVNQMTLTNGVEMTIRRLAPEVKSVSEVNLAAKA
jgi:Fe-S cluster biogenesis protein NfuA